MTGTIRRTVGTTTASGDYIEVVAELRRNDPSGLSDGFSITGAIWEARRNARGDARKRRGLDCDAAGCIHEEITRAFPRLVPLVALHLAGPDGVPMYAVENGWHFYSGAASRYEREQIARGHDYGYSRALETPDHDRAARALRIAPANLPQGMGRAAFEAFADTLRERWCEEARAGIGVLESMIDGQGVAR